MKKIITTALISSFFALTAFGQTLSTSEMIERSEQQTAIKAEANLLLEAWESILCQKRRSGKEVCLLINPQDGCHFWIFKQRGSNQSFFKLERKDVDTGKQICVGSLKSKLGEYGYKILLQNFD